MIIMKVSMFVRLKNKGYNYVVQFEKNGKDYMEPLVFKSAKDVGPFMRSEKCKMKWTKKIENYIEELCPLDKNISEKE